MKPCACEELGGALKETLHSIHEVSGCSPSTPSLLPADLKMLKDKQLKEKAAQALLLGRKAGSLQTRPSYFVAG